MRISPVQKDLEHMNGLTFSTVCISVLWIGKSSHL